MSIVTTWSVFLNPVTYTIRNITPIEACTHHNFFCTLQNDDTPKSVLRPLHPYYSQVQGQMPVGDRPWCDFVIYTTKSITVERILTAHFGKVNCYQNSLTFMTIV